MWYRVCTLMWGTAWQRYGRQFSQTFAEFWPESVELAVITDHPLPIQAKQIDLASIPGVAGFRSRWSTSPRANGLETPEGEKVDANGYSWRLDAMKWMPQAVSPLAAARDMADGNCLIWLDADVETTAPVDEKWLAGLIGDADVACLQRGDYHSEIGFIGFRLNARTRALIVRFAELFTSDEVFKLRHWHSAFAFDDALKSIPGIKVRNLNPANGKGHVWPHTVLAERTVHKKGKRKGQ